MVSLAQVGLKLSIPLLSTPVMLGSEVFTNTPTWNLSVDVYPLHVCANACGGRKLHLFQITLHCNFLRQGISFRLSRLVVQ